jgi:hypothetical protein
MDEQTKKQTVLFKLKHSIGPCVMCKNQARWVMQVTDCASIARVPFCDKHRPKMKEAK